MSVGRARCSRSCRTEMARLPFGTAECGDPISLAAQKKRAELDAFINSRVPPCECADGCACSKSRCRPPAMLMVTRNGKRLFVCEKCDLRSDSDAVWANGEILHLENVIDVDAW